MARTKDKYDLSSPDPGREVAAPDLPYQPRDPVSYRPAIGLIGCGGISAHHLTAYKAAGYRVVAFCDLVRSRAEGRAAEFYPGAATYTDAGELLRRDDIEVVDIATHPTERAPLIEAAILSGKHILSQKPFVTDLDRGERLVDLADQKGVRLAVNQNGRWAPHFSYIRQAIAAGLLGDVIAAHLSVHWDHNWIIGSEFNRVRHIVLYDFAIHWFDIVTQFMGDRTATRVYASNARTASQRAAPPLLGQALIEYDGAQASLGFDADVKFGPEDRTYVAGTAGAVSSVGPSLGDQALTLYTARGRSTPDLKGAWFPDGFHGSMAELLCSIEESRPPGNSARGNLKSLALCFAACASAEERQPKTPGEVRRMPG